MNDLELDRSDTASTAPNAPKEHVATKKEKRRQKEALKKAEEQTLSENKAARKHSVQREMKLPTGNTRQESRPSKATQRRGNKSQNLVDPDAGLDDAGLNKLCDEVKTKGEKLTSKWGAEWQGAPESRKPLLMKELLLRLAPLLGDRPLRIICLGLGSPVSDRTAQIQLALLIELAAGLKVRLPLLTRLMLGRINRGIRPSMAGRRPQARSMLRCDGYCRKPGR